MKFLVGIFCFALLSSCFIGIKKESVVLQNNDETNGDYIVCHWTSEEDSFFLNQTGDTIIPIGKYQHSFTDTIFSFGIVSTGYKIHAINTFDSILFDVFIFDNGPDYINDGLFRIIRDGKIGYANERGEIVIQPQYQCAYPFENGKAQVAVNCTETIEFEMKKWESTEWITIDKKGNVIKN